MTDETLDFYEQKRERELVARTGISRSLTPQKQLTRKEWEKMNGEVVTIKPALPNLPTMSERIKYLMGGMTRQEFADKIYYSVPVVGHWLRGYRIPSDDAMHVIAKRFNVPFEWVKGNEQPKSRKHTQEPIEPEEHPAKQADIKKNVSFSINFNGSMTGAELKQYISVVLDNNTYSVCATIEKEADNESQDRT